jgi:AcrR family transcriptional regulator
VASDTPGRRALIDATVAIIETKGLAGASMRAITRRAEVSHAAPAHHFGDKAGLFGAVALEGFAMAHTSVTAAIESSKQRGPVGRMQALGVAYVAFAVDHPGHFEVMFRPELVHADDPELIAAAAATFMLFRDTVHSAQQDGFAPQWDLDDLTLTSWSFVHGIVQLSSHGALRALGFPVEPAALTSRLSRLVGEAIAGLDPA